MTLETELVTAVGEEFVEAIDPTSYRVRPGSPAEVAEVIRRAGAYKAAVHPVGAAARQASHGR
ncbi:MAG TPA: hypothetical protein VFO79_06060, partial [Xanthomonadales bacterium]|nr:hypothetical protein [Xanthomonadales bacterium]